MGTARKRRRVRTHVEKARERLVEGVHWTAADREAWAAHVAAERRRTAHRGPRAPS